MNSRSICERLLTSKTAISSLVTAGFAGIGATIVNGYNAVSSNNLSQHIHSAALNGTVTQQAQHFENEAFHVSRVSGISVLTTVALPTAVLTIPAVAEWKSVGDIANRYRQFMRNIRFNIGMPCQLAGLGLIIKAANEDGAHNPQLAIAWGVGGMMLLNIGNVLVLSDAKPSQSGVFAAEAKDLDPSAPILSGEGVDPGTAFSKLGYGSSRA